MVHKDKKFFWNGQKNVITAHFGVPAQSGGGILRAEMSV
jgi:hypothetical protein